MTIPSIVRYPFDLTGLAPSNRITEEPHLVPRTNNRAFPLVEGLFYGESVVIRTASGTVLQRNVDYELLYLHQDLTVKSGKAVYHIVHITTPDYEGTVECDYQVVGGYSTNYAAIQQIIDTLNVDSRPVLWENIIGVPVEFPPSPHLHHANELYGMEDVVTALNEIAAQIELQTSNTELIQALYLEVEALKAAQNYLFLTTNGSLVAKRRHLLRANGIVLTLPPLLTLQLGDSIELANATDSQSATIVVSNPAGESISWNQTFLNATITYNIVQTIRFVKVSNTEWRVVL